MHRPPRRSADRPVRRTLPTSAPWRVAPTLMAVAVLATPAAHAQSTGVPGASPAAGAPAAGASPTAATPPAGASVPRDTTRPTVVRGTVHDSTAGVPLAGALLQLLPLADRNAQVTSATADSLGRFRIAGLAPGDWALGFVHPALDAYGLDLPTVRVRLAPGDSLDVALAIPGPRVMHALLCPDRPAGDSTGGILGSLRSATTGDGLEGATVSVSWAELQIGGGVRTVQRRVPATTGVAGVFRFCGVPADGPVILRAETGAAGDSTLASGDIELPITPGALARVELAAGTRERVADAAAPPMSGSGRPPATAQPGAVPALRGRARLAGTVRDDKGRPVANARVLLLGAGREAKTSAAGSFQLDSVPGGSWTAEARAIGYTPTRTTVTLLDARAATVALAFGDRVAMLDRVQVCGKQSRMADFLSEFAQRKRTSQGRFLLADDVMRAATFQITDAFRMIPGARVFPGELGRNTLLLRGPGGAEPFCAANVYIDGVRVFDGATELDFLVRPSDVMAMEVYTGTRVPPQFLYGDGGRACGAVVIWTKR